MNSRCGGGHHFFMDTFRVLNNPGDFWGPSSYPIPTCSLPFPITAKISPKRVFFFQISKTPLCYSNSLMILPVLSTSNYSVLKGSCTRKQFSHFIVGQTEAGCKKVGSFNL
jgi:hypothetical protein